MVQLIKLTFVGRVCCGQKSVAGICSRLQRVKLYELIEACLPGGGAMCDAMPFLGMDCYIPKPAFITKGLLDLSLADHKFHRVMKYLKLSELAAFHEGAYQFADHAGQSFGRYRKDPAGDRFEFLPEAGICFLLRGAQPLSPDSMQKICSALQDGIPERLLPGCGAIEVCCEPAGAEWESLLAEENTGALLTLGQLDTTRMSREELRLLLEGAAYQAAYHPEGTGIVLLPGALIRNGSALTEPLICIEMRKLLCNEMYC